MNLRPQTARFQANGRGVSGRGANLSHNPAMQPVSGCFHVRATYSMATSTPEPTHKSAFGVPRDPRRDSKTMTLPRLPQA
jgi:hypothetical protein